MGVYGSAPESPSASETAAAQTATNVSTATANSYMNNINQVTPDGNRTYSQSGTQKVYDPNSKTYMDIPTWTETTTLSDQQNAIKTQEDGANLNMATLANTQSGKLNSILGQSLDLSSAPAASNPSALSTPSYTSYQSGPTLNTSVADAGNITNSIANAGDITKSYDVNYDTSKYEQALMDRLNPQLQQDESALEAKLVNQGLQPGSEAYNRAYEQQNQKSNDARIAAILNAGQEQTRVANLKKDQATFQNSAQAQQYSQNANDSTFANSAQSQQYGQNYQNAGFTNSALQQMYSNQNTATSGNNALADQTFNAERAKNSDLDNSRSQYLNEQYAQRNQGINEISSLMNGGQVDNPNFSSTQGQTMPTVDYAGLVNQQYQNELASYNQSQQGIGSILGGVATAATALSDRRAKKDIEKVGTVKGMGLYEYAYKGKHDDGQRHVGVMAQEVEKKRPDAVSKGRDGLRRVNYGKLFEAGKR
ncbi:tail fiber domain-containing protein [Agrobacterium vitis]|uniref:tail fiber domain-containing protein n=1 Tax=Agrobacterium vitis TaxID=373 RepID=UPI001572AE17|nr:tail fiber domain-containing protein [Agrobacterium vitis]NSZ42840.1 tail fiber domain-containing protein [Agrobacterium vitis]